MTERKRELANVRADIDHVDAELVRLLAERAALVREAFAFKRERGVALSDAPREREIVERAIANGAARGLPESAVREVFEAILRFAKLVQPKG